MSTNKSFSNQWTTKIYKEKNAMMLYVLPKVGMFKKLPFHKIYEFSNLDVHTFMEHMHVFMISTHSMLDVIHTLGQAWTKILCSNSVY